MYWYLLKSRKHNHSAFRFLKSSKRHDTSILKKIKHNKIVYRFAIGVGHKGFFIVGFEISPRSRRCWCSRVLSHSLSHHSPQCRGINSLTKAINMSCWKPLNPRWWVKNNLHSLFLFCSYWPSSSSTAQVQKPPFNVKLKKKQMPWDLHAGDVTAGELSANKFLCNDQHGFSFHRQSNTS